GHRPAAVRGELPGMNEMIELLARRVLLVHRRIPASTVHLVHWEEVNRGAAGKVFEHLRSFVLGARNHWRRQSGHQQRAPIDRNAARSRSWRRAITKAAASFHGTMVQNERARPDGEASTNTTAPSSSSTCRP